MNHNNSGNGSRQFLLQRERETNTTALQIVMSQSFRVHKKMISHTDGEDLAGTDSRTFFCFGSFAEVTIKRASRKIQVHKPKSFEFGCVQSRSREEALIIQEVLAERLQMAQWSNSMNLYDAIDGFNCPTRDGIQGKNSPTGTTTRCSESHLPYSTAFYPCQMH